MPAMPSPTAPSPAMPSRSLPLSAYHAPLPKATQLADLSMREELFGLLLAVAMVGATVLALCFFFH